jgi:hypothetical protein
LTHFALTDPTLSNPLISGDLANPSHDGVVNLLDYAFDGDPNVNGSAKLPVQSVTTVNGLQYLTVTIFKKTLVSDLNYLPEISNDLVTWNSGTSDFSETEITDPNDSTLTDIIVQSKTPMSQTQKQFIHVKIQGPFPAPVPQPPHGGG